MTKQTSTLSELSERRPARARRAEMTLRVSAVEPLSANITRIVFHDTSGLLSRANEGDYLKMCFPLVSGNAAGKSNEATAPTRTRSYTIREADQSSGRIVIDFVCHEPAGPAAEWATRTQAGESITAYGPGPGKPIDSQCSWFLAAADMTALPALAVHLKNLPAQARGYAIIEIGCADDRQPLQHPDGVELEWVINSDHKSSPSIMREKVAAKDWLSGDCFVWIASEFEVARTLRNFLQTERNLQKGQYYISSYWKLGDTDEGNKKAKKHDGGF